MLIAILMDVISRLAVIAIKIDFMTNDKGLTFNPK